MGGGRQGGHMKAGRSMIDFARSFMPALAAAEESVGADGGLEGRRVGVSLTLEPKTACLVEALGRVGAEVAVFGGANSTRPEVVEALEAEGVPVFAQAGAGRERVEELRGAFLDQRLELLADDGATNTRVAHQGRRDVLDTLVGVAEETTSGVRPLRVMHEQGALAVPCIAVNDARAKLLFDNTYGTGQSVVMATLDATRLCPVGMDVVVVGYGRVGRGIAGFASAMGGRVIVTEVDPVEGLAALHDGHEVAPLAEAVPRAAVVFTATGIGHSLTGDHLALMPEGAIVAVGGAGPPELDPGSGAPVEEGDEVARHVRAVRTASGRTVYLVAGGHCANTTAGEGNPIEVMDLSLALQLHALAILGRQELPVGVHLLPRWVEEAVASAQLQSTGTGVDRPTEAQLEAARSW
jgi:adenosylhomocysteinase